MGLKLPRIIGLYVLVLCACSCTTDITKNPGARTDFVVGGLYELKKAAWLFGDALMTLREKEPLDSNGILNPGTKIVVPRVILERSPKMGTYTEVFGEVVTGVFKGKIVNMSVISERSKDGYTRRDPAMLALVEESHQ